MHKYGFDGVVYDEPQSGDNVFKRLAADLITSFIWHDTLQGNEYWREVYNNLVCLGKP